jgi:hypothetical protein
LTRRADLILICIITFVLFTNILGQDNIESDPTTFVFPTYKHSYGIRKAGSTELFLFMGFRVKFKSPQGLACVRLEAWEDPDDPHDNDEVTVYGVNSGQNNIIYNSSMWGLDVYGLDEEDNQRLSEPHGICANSQGDVYVADSGNHRIVRLYNPGDKLGFVSELGKEGSRPGNFRYPKQVTMDPEGNIYVSDTGNHRIQIFNNQDSLIRIIGDDGLMMAPNGIAVAHASERHRYRPDNFIILIDSLDQRISKYDLRGNLMLRKNIKSTGYPQGRLEYVCLDYYNQLLVTDSYNNCLHKFDKNLAYITSFGRRGEDDHQFIEPTGIAIYRRFGQLFIAEANGAQYYWVGTDLKNFDIEDKKTSILFRFSLTEPSFVYLDIFDNKNKFVKRVADKQFLHPLKLHTLFWNLRMARNLPHRLFEEEITLSELADANQKLPPGEYTAKITIEATYSSRTYFEKSVEKKFTVGEISVVK